MDCAGLEIVARHARLRANVQPVQILGQGRHPGQGQSDLSLCRYRFGVAARYF